LQVRQVFSKLGIGTLKPEKIFQYYFLSLGLIALLCFLWLAFIPSDLKGSILFGFSPMRLLLLGILLVLMTISFFLVLSNNHPKRRKLLWQKIDYHVKEFSIIRGLSLIAFSIALSFLIFFPYFNSGLYLPYYQRLQPLAVWFFCFSLESPLAISYYLKSKNKTASGPDLQTIKVAFFIFIFMLFLWIFIATTGVGITRDPSYWDDHHPVPLLEGQLLIVAFGAAFLLLGYLFIQKFVLQKIKTTVAFKPILWMDVVLFLLIWLSAFLLWSNQPIPNSYFTPPVRPPNYEVYPFSDASLYDSNAQSILLGEIKSNSRVIIRPLFSIFLAGLHSLGGQNYSRIILLQTILLAMIPSVLYIIGKKTSSRLAGLSLGVFIILLELNRLKVASLVTTSNTKLLMTELPTTLILAVLILGILIFSKKTTFFRIYPLYIGVIFGLLVLLRSQTLFLFPIIVGIFIFILYKNKKRILEAVGLLTLAVLLVITPLILRNWQLTGKLAIEDPNATQLVIQLYQNDKNQTGSESQENMNGEEPPDLFGAMINFILRNPGEYIGFVGNNFLHNEILSIFTLPVRPFPIQDLNQFINPVDLFWVNNKNINYRTMSLLLVFLAIICIGIASAYSQNKFIGLIPLVFHLAYNFSSALSRFSGWRFIMPVNWILLLYFSIGLIQLVKLFLVFFGFSQKGITSSLIIEQNSEVLDSNKNQFPTIGLIGGISVAIILGLSILATMTFIPSRYANQNRGELIQDLTKNPAWKDSLSKKEGILDLLNSKNVFIEKGMAFYPRFYNAGDGEPTRSASAYQTREFPRLVFLLIGNDRRELVFPIRESPLYFPNGSEVIIVYRIKPDRGYEILLIDLPGENPALYFKDPTLLVS
jgi:hypothetical protein